MTREELIFQISADSRQFVTGVQGAANAGAGFEAMLGDVEDSGDDVDRMFAGLFGRIDDLKGSLDKTAASLRKEREELDRVEDSLEDVERQTDRVAKAKDRAGRSTGIFSSSIAKLGAAAAAYLSIRFLSDLVATGREADRSVSIVDRVFGEAAESINDFIDSWATMAGATSHQARELTSSAGRIANAMGMVSDESAEFSISMIRIAADLAAVEGRDISDTFDTLTSAVTGSTESLKQYGIILRQEDINQRAMVETGKSAVATITEQERAQAALNLIYERAGTTVGYLEARKDSLSGRMRIVTTMAREQYEVFAKSLVPTFLMAFAYLQDIFEASDQAARGLGERLAGAVMWLTRLILLLVDSVVHLLSRIGRGLNVLVNYAKNMNWVSRETTLADIAFAAVTETVDFLAKSLDYATAGFMRFYEWGTRAIIGIEQAVTGQINVALVQTAVRIRENTNLFIEDARAANESREARRAAILEEYEAMRANIQATASATAASEELAASTANRTTLLEQQMQRYRELTAVVAELSGQDGHRIRQIERQNRLLEAQADILRSGGTERVGGAGVMAGGGEMGMDDQTAAAARYAEQVRAREEAERFNAVIQDGRSGIRDSIYEHIEGLTEMGAAHGSWAERIADYWTSATDVIRDSWWSIVDSVSDTFGNLAHAAGGMFDAMVESSTRALVGAGVEHGKALEQSQKKYMAFFQIWKAVSIAQAIVDTYKAATTAYSAMAGIPFVGPVLGGAAAAAAIAAGLANVAMIRSAQPGGGGGSAGGGGGGGSASMPIPRINIAGGVATNAPGGVFGTGIDQGINQMTERLNSTLEKIDETLTGLQEDGIPVTGDVTYDLDDMSVALRRHDQRVDNVR